MTKLTRINTSLFTKAGYVVVAALAFVTKSYAQAVPSGSIVAPSNRFGSITNLQTLFQWIFNFLRWIGWVGVVLGILWIIVVLIYKIFFAPDSEEAMKNVQSQLTKAVLVVIAGLLLVSMGYIVTTVFTLFGAGTVPALNLDPTI